MTGRTLFNFIKNRIHENRSKERLVREIADAMQSYTNEFGNRWFLNLTEQEVGIRVDPYYCDPDCLWPNDGDEVVEIDRVPSREAFRAMEAFADEQPERVANKLYRALSGNRSFARFKAAADVLDLVEEWYDYQNNWYKEKAEEWMQENGVSFNGEKIVSTGRVMTWFEDREDEEYDEEV